jgi:hypothetical protein
MSWDYLTKGSLIVMPGDCQLKLRAASNFK